MVDKTQLHVDHYRQKNIILDGWGDYEVCFNYRLSNTNGIIVLLVDNAGCHPEELKGQFSNMLCFFHPSCNLLT